MLPFQENLDKRLIRWPKVYVADSGLVCHLLGIDTAAELTRSPFRGALFEGLIAAEQGLEVDFPVPGRAETVDLVECKAGRRMTPSMAAPMLRLATALSARRRHAAETKMFLVHQSSRVGAPTTAVAPGMRAPPWQGFLGEL